MKKLKFTLKFALFLMFVFISAQSANAQNAVAYGLSDLLYDQVTGRVRSYSGTYLNYAARVHYDPAVCGNLYQEYARIASRCYTGYNSAYDSPQERVYGSLVGFQTTNASPADTRFDILSDHYVVAYYYVIITIEDGEGPPGLVRKYYDPLSLYKGEGGGQNLGSHDYNGALNYDYASFFEVQYFFLGRTARSIIANATICPTSLAPCPAPTPLKVELRNEFKGNQDISGTSQNALLGERTTVTAVTTGGNNSAKSYNWLVDNQTIESCGTNAGSCTFVLSDIKDTPVTVIVSQSQQTPVQKNLTVKGVLPKLKENPPTSPTGFSLLERTPRVTLGGGDCAYQTVRIMLGCTDAIYDADPRPPLSQQLKNISGIYAKATVSLPENIISKRDRLGVELYQIVKPSRTRLGKTSSGQNFTDVGRYATNPDGWRLDFRGVLNENGNYRFFGRFNESGEITLDYPDTPSETLTNTTANSEPLIEYNISEDFKIYTKCFSITISNSDPDINYALQVIPWNWRAKATKNTTTNKWRLEGNNFYPTSNQTINSQNIQFTKGSTGIETVGGGFRDVFGWERTSVSSLPPVDIRTKKDVAVWRKNNGVWYVMNADGSVQAATQWGVDYDVPVPGDYDGDGRTDLAVYRPSTSSWYAVKSSNNTYYSVQFGQVGDTPIPSDYDGDGIDEPAVWSPSSATWSTFSSSTQLTTTQAWGTSSDIPVIGDYDGDGKTDIANWQSNGNWHILLSGSGQTRDVSFGLPTTDKPVPGDYDGDGKTDIAVWRTNGTQVATWIILNSSNGQTQYQSWGTEGDVPIPAAYNR